MDVRLAGPRDLDHVLGAPYLLDEPPHPGAVRAYLGDPRNVTFLAWEGGRVVGFLRGTELGQWKGPRKQMLLYEVEVEDGFRRKGVGRALVEALLAHCRERDFEEVFVFTDDPGNQAAHALYMSTGGRTETKGDRMYVYRLA